MRSKDSSHSRRNAVGTGQHATIMQASHRSCFLPLMAGLTVTAWLMLWLCGQIPYARYLHHGKWTELAIASRLCRALQGGGETLTGVLFVGGWF